MWCLAGVVIGTAATADNCEPLREGLGMLITTLRWLWLKPKDVGRRAGTVLAFVIVPCSCSVSLSFSVVAGGESVATGAGSVIRESVPT